MIFFKKAQTKTQAHDTNQNILNCMANRLVFSNKDNQHLYQESFHFSHLNLYLTSLWAATTIFPIIQIRKQEPK